MLSIFGISRLAGPETGLQRGMDLERGNQRRNARNGRQRETNLHNVLDGGVLEVGHSCLGWNRQTTVGVYENVRRRGQAGEYHMWRLIE